MWICWTQRQAAGEVEDRFSLAAGGQHAAGHPGEGSGSRYARYSAQRTDGEGAGYLEHYAHGGRSVLAVTRQGGQSFVFVAHQQDGHWSAQQTSVTLGDTVGNSYAISSGLKPGDKVIVSSTQFLVNGMPVMLLGA